MSLSVPDSATRNRSDSMEDQELPEHERKRPRLSEGQGDMGEKLNAVNAVALAKEAESHQKQESVNSLLSPPLPPRNSDRPPSASPTSKVTINTRPLSSQAMTNLTAPTLPMTKDDEISNDQKSDAIMKDGNQSAGSNPLVPDKHHSTDQHETISISSSPSRSPEIEVADVEDFDQHPGQTRWTTRIGSGGTTITTTTTTSLQPAHVYRTFPHANERKPGEAKLIVQRISRVFLEGDQNDGEIFRRVKDWFVDFVTRCNSFDTSIIDEDPQFWNTIPILIEMLLKRDASAPAHARLQDLIEFFVAYGQIAKLMIEFDTRKLIAIGDSSDADALKNFTLTSQAYLLPLAWIFNHRTPFYDHLRALHNFDCMTIISVFADRLTDPETVALPKTLANMLLPLGKLLSKKLAFLKQFQHIVVLSSQLMQPFNIDSSGMQLCQSFTYDHIDSLRMDMFEVLRHIDDVLQLAIIKQASWLTIDTGSEILGKLNPLMRLIAIEIPQVGKDVISSAGVTFLDTDITDLPITMCYAWKFKTLRKFITHGRMELRVYGVETISNDLLHVYQKYIVEKPDGFSDPLVQFLVRFIQQNKLIDYIIGVDSHPQLIQRSSKIVGFLAVAQSYSNRDTDSIWQAVLESQDQRTVSEILNVLQFTFQTFETWVLQYLCEKLFELPFARFDTRMLQFTTNLLNQIRQKGNLTISGRGRRFDPITRSLCIRLLREASTPDNAALEQAVLVRREISGQLTDLLQPIGIGRDHLCLEDDEENELLLQICSDVQAHSEFACGSFQIMNSMLALLTSTGMLNLLEKCNFMGLLVEDFKHLQHRLMINDSEISPLTTSEFESRMTCLFFLILYVPELFNHAILEGLWDFILTSHHMPDIMRSQAWDTVTNVMKQCKQPNPVIDELLEDFFPKLRSFEFSKAVLDFAQQAVVYESRRNNSIAPVTQEVISVPGIERVWRIMLEASPGTVETEATDFIIQQYLEGSVICRLPSSSHEATLSALVDRCVQQTIASAARLKSFGGSSDDKDDGMDIIESTEEIQAEELRFDRSLFFLRRFLKAHNDPRRGARAARLKKPLPDFKNKLGDDLEISLQLPNSSFVTNEVQKIVVGTENTGADIWQYLADSSGYAQFFLFHWGQRLEDIDPKATLKELNLDKGLIIVHRSAGTSEKAPMKSGRSSSPVDNKVMHHFSELYSLLDCHERIAKEVFNFLIVSSGQNEIMKDIRSRTKTPTELLPPNRPYRLLYCTRALRSCIEHESFNSTPDTGFLLYCTNTIITVLPQVTVESAENHLQMSIAHDLCEALLLAFRTKVPTEVSRSYIQNHTTFLKQVLRILSCGLDFNCNLETPISQALVRVPIETLVEACLHDDKSWDVLNRDAEFITLLEDAVLVNGRVEIRRTVLEVFLGLTGASGTKFSLKMNDLRAPRARFSTSTIEACLSHMWTAMLKILEHVQDHSYTCQEALDATLVTMRRIGKTLPIDEHLEQFHKWSRVLTTHTPQESVGQPTHDQITGGISKLLQECCKILRAANALPHSIQLVELIFLKFLFPPLSESKSTVQPVVIPILDATVRESLYDLSLALCQSNEEIDVLVGQLNNDFLPDDMYEPAYAYERQSLRSEAGYGGLKNLSNTCYLNSLFSQLFMNVQFRALLLNVSVIDESKQKLIVEMSKVFAYMQDHYDKSVDPTSAIESITTYDGEQIDVTIQMDVDEFFNLLFDRLEGQIVDAQVRNQFKSIYGGQLVQQIKSKECEHVSERLEPFSAVQVEIKGQLRLEDSLKAYVEGEVLQGENKYSCTSCGRHVDAVKRACLKDVPDNLIFNLKRFDYDIMTGMRCKINDEFQFPETIDVAPYTLAHLSCPDEPIEPDLFELTGIIVHSGTADSGHYYSFIRHRPSVKDKSQAWVQFNDQDVTTFDPSQIQDACFGGMDNSNVFNMAKFYNAYMLFYQRSSSIARTEQEYIEHDILNPIRLPLPVDMSHHISQQNELFLRSYCAQDSSHARFVRQLLERMKGSGNDQCSEEHNMETRALEMTLNYVQQVSSRWKGLPEFEGTMKIIGECAGTCVQCAKVIFHWFLGAYVISDTVVRSPFQLVRKGFGTLLVTGLENLFEARNGLDEEDASNLKFIEDYQRSLSLCLSQLAKCWDIILRAGRPWTEYFGLLNSILELGDEEAACVIEEDFLLRCLEILLVHNNNPTEYPISKRLRSHTAAYLNAREKNRPFNHAVLIRFLTNLIEHVDFRVLPTGEFRGQNPVSGKPGPSNEERTLLGLSSMPNDFDWLRRLIAGRQAPNSADRIVAYLISERTIAGTVSDSLMKGLEHKSMVTAASFLAPTLAFCEFCMTENQILDLASAALEGIYTIGLEYGKEYLDFVVAMTRLRNDQIESEVGFLTDVVLQHVQHWAPVFLLSPNDVHHDVRGETIDLLKQILIGPADEMEVINPSYHRVLKGYLQELAIGARKYVQEMYLSPHSRESAALQPGQVNQLIDVVGRCLDYFDIDDPVQGGKASTVQNTMTLLRMKAEQSADTMSSAEWQENSSEVEGAGDSDFEEIANNDD